MSEDTSIVIEPTPEPEVTPEVVVEPEVVETPVVETPAEEVK